MFENQNNFSYNLIILKKLIYNNVVIIFFHIWSKGGGFCDNRIIQS